MNSGVHRKRVLLLADNPYVGGITSHLITIVRAFGQAPFANEFEVRLATLPGRNASSALIEAAESIGAPAHVFAMRSTFDWRVLGAIRAYIEEQGIELVHTHGYRGALLMRLAAPAVPVVSTCHGPAVAPAFRTRLWEWLALRAMRRHVCVIACCEYVRNWLLGVGLPPSHVKTVLNACWDDAPDPPEAARLRESIGAAANDTVFLYAGRLVAGKGLEQLVEAAARMPSALLAIAGDGPLRAALEQRVRTLGLRCAFLGAMQRMGTCYSAADVVVLASWKEALPMALIEAAARGKPAIATAVGGVPEIVERGVTGLLVSPRQNEALLEAMQALSDPARREAFGQAARAAWHARFTPERMAGNLAEIYRACLAREGGPG